MDRVRGLGGARARAGTGVFAGPGRPAKVTHDMFCILGTRVTLNASLRLDSLRSLGSARVSRQSRGVQGSGRPAPLKPQPGYARYPTAVPRVIARADPAPSLESLYPSFGTERFLLGGVGRSGTLPPLHRESALT